MKWLTESFTREGPGIPKDEPKKTGLALFAQILRREWWELFKLNLAIIVFSLPLITIPATLAGAMRICQLMVEDENIYLMREFTGAFRRLFWRASLCGLAFGAVLAIAGYGVFVYAQLVPQALPYALALALAVVTSLFLWMVAAHFFLLMVRAPALSTATLLRLSALAALYRPLPALGALAFIAALWLAHILFYPASVFMPVAFNFSLGTLALVFATWRASEFALSREQQSA
ncbi:DUF624 domain-containing protein [Radicibacter daui]|uniref:DUF624 domain-containing protein n=1 Tax=Radicibacter daui TaxID=3064829 RepID=UPI0040469B0D